MVGFAKKSLRKRKHIEDIVEVSQDSGRDVITQSKQTQVSPHASQEKLVPIPRDESPEHIFTYMDILNTTEVPQDAPTSSQTVQDLAPDLQSSKKKRGPTKMKKIAETPDNRVQVEFTEMGVPCGEGSVTLSSYLGALVRENVPVTLSDWRRLDNEKKIILWKDLQARYNLDEGWQKDCIFKQMGRIWRSSKSRLVTQVCEALNKEKRLQLKPDNIKSISEWNKFVKLKTSPTFKAISDKFKALRKKQIPHTCSRKGMARLAIDMKKNSANPSSISRVKVWIKSRTKKDGTPVNAQVAKTIDELKKVESDSPSSFTTNVREDALSKVLGHDKPGRLRGMGGGMTISKLALFQARDKYITHMQEQHTNMQGRVKQLESLVENILKNKTQQSEEEENMSPLRVNTNSLEKCKLLDWTGNEEIVAEGYWFSSDPSELVNFTPLGPNAVKVLVNISKKPDAFLWRPTPNLTCIQQALSKAIAWPTDKVVQIRQQSEEQDNISSPSSTLNTNSKYKCKLLDWTGKKEIVAEGRWSSSDPKKLVHDIPLGPNAMKVWVDISKKSDAFLWRPTPDMICIEDAIGTTIAWPAERVVLETNQQFNEYHDNTSPSSVHTKSKNKCKLLDFNGSGKVVAEGRWTSSDPNQVVHFVPLGPNAMRVWVDIPRIPDASLWRPTCEMDCIEEAIGSMVAWPTDKVIMF